MHVLIFHLQVPLSLLRLPHFDWTLENSASGSSFKVLSNRGQTATVTWQRSAVQWSSHLPDSNIGCFSTPATPYFIFADISKIYCNLVPDLIKLSSFSCRYLPFLLTQNTWFKHHIWDVISFSVLCVISPSSSFLLQGVLNLNSPTYDLNSVFLLLTRL